MAADLQQAIKTQGDLIRSLKGENAPKEKVIQFTQMFVTSMDSDVNAM